MAEKSRMTREWVERVWADNPCLKLDNGNVRFVARLGFVNLLERPKPGSDGKERAYGAVLLLPEMGGAVSMAPLQAEVSALFGEKAPLALQNAEVMKKYNNPFKKQDGYVDKKTGQLFDGFVMGRFCISANSSQSKPSVVDINGAPIVDKSGIYSGCWAIVAVRPAWYKNESEGATCYLQSVMKIADDENLGGVGQSNPSQDFAGVKIDPTVNPAAAFGVGGTTAAQQAAIDMMS